MQITKYILEIYKFSSYIFLFYFFGWFSEKYFALNLHYTLLLIFFLISIQLLLFKKKNFLTIFVILLLFGNLVGQNKNLYLNMWFQNSLEQLKFSSLGFFLLKVKWKMEGNNINIFVDKDDVFIPSEDLQNFSIGERLVFSLDYLEPFIIYYDKNKKIKKQKIIKSSSNAGVIYSDNENNFVLYNSQTGNLLKRIKIGEDKKIIDKWEIKGKYFFHHWGDFFNNRIYIPGRRYLEIELLKKANFFKYKNCQNKYVNQDVIYIIDFDTGKLLEEIDIFDILLNSKISKKIKDCVNPIHLNDIEIIKKTSHLKYFDNVNIGDFLISLRNINTILLIDHKTKEIKWSYENELIMQHSPQITDKGTLLIFNNQGSKEIEGQSRIDEVDLKTKKIVGIYDGVKNNFFSQKRGRIQYLNNRIFIQESQKSNMFEIVCKNKYISNDCERRDIVTINSETMDIFQSFAIDFF